ncbi:MAG: type II toxin-antitoxin system HicA family toxin [Nanoarchaeota archaeon]
MDLRNLKSKRVLKAFLKMGFEIKAQKGTHVIVSGYIRGEKKTFPIPIHKEIISVGTITAILNRQAKISREEFFKYY